MFQFISISIKENFQIYFVTDTFKVVQNQTFCNYMFGYINFNTINNIS